MRAIFGILLVIGHVVLFAVWNATTFIAMFGIPGSGDQYRQVFPDPAGPAVGLLLFVSYMAFLLRIGRRQFKRRWARLRLRSLRGRTLGWTLTAIPVILTLSWALGEVYTSIVPVPPGTFDPFGSLLGTIRGKILVAVLAIVIAPVAEEVFFRGLLQPELERSLGAARGIAVTAFLFAFVHLLPQVLPLHFFLGLAFGFVVYATRSIWSGILLHVANNSLAILGLATGERSTAQTTIWEAGPTPGWWLALVLLFPATLAAIWVGRKLWQAGHGRSGQHLATPDLLVSHVSR